MSIYRFAPRPPSWASPIGVHTPIANERFQTAPSAACTFLNFDKKNEILPASLARHARSRTFHPPFSLFSNAGPEVSRCRFRLRDREQGWISLWTLPAGFISRDAVEGARLFVIFSRETRAIFFLNKGCKFNKCTRRFLKFFSFFFLPTLSIFLKKKDCNCNVRVIHVDSPVFVHLRLFKKEILLNNQPSYLLLIYPGQVQKF